MKNSIPLFYLFILIIGSNCCITTQAKNANFSKLETKDNYSNHDSLFKVTRIDSLNNFYVVYIQMLNHKFKVVSRKENSAHCKVIQIDSTYYFNLRSILNSSVQLGDKTLATTNNALVTCFTFEENTRICKEDGINDLHRALNLSGLCIY